jgi:hypothetical protein
VNSPANGKAKSRMKKTFLVVLLVSSASASPALAADPLITGEYIYDISINGPGGALSGSLTGSMELACTAYTMKSQFELEMPSITGGGKVSMNVTQVEDGATLDFDSSSSLNGQTTERSLGKATRADESLTIDLKEPKETVRTVERKVVFPIQFVEELIAAAKEGKTFVEHAYFDGTGTGTEVTSVSVFITPIAADAAIDEDALLAADLGFGELQRWRTRVSYFSEKATGGEQTPMFTTEMVLYENGFTLAASYDLGFGSMDLRLVEFKPIPPKPC